MLPTIYPCHTECFLNSECDWHCLLEALSIADQIKPYLTDRGGGHVGWKGGRHGGRHGGGQGGQIYISDWVRELAIWLMGPNFFDLKLTTQLVHLLCFASWFLLQSWQKVFFSSLENWSRPKIQQQILVLYGKKWTGKNRDFIKGGRGGHHFLKYLHKKIFLVWSCNRFIYIGRFTWILKRGCSCHGSAIDRSFK